VYIYIYIYIYTYIYIYIADGEKFAQAAQRCIDGAVEAVEEALSAV